MFLILEKFLLNKFFAKLPKFISHIYVIFLILVSFTIFSANGLDGMLSDVGALFGAGGIPFWNAETAYYLSGYAVVLVVAAFGSTPVLKNAVLKIKSYDKVNKVINILEPVLHVVLLLIITAYFVDGSFSPFLYFRF